MKKLITLFILFFLLVTACKESITDPEPVAELPGLFPDYTDVTIPATIAPLNFTMLDNVFEKIHLNIRGEKGGTLEIEGKKYIDIPEKKWKQLLADNTGNDLQWTVSVKTNGKWKQYATFPVHVSEYSIDYGLVYRLIAPGYEVYSKMGIYQRDLSNFKQSAIIENTIAVPSCMNCHSFNQTRPDAMSLHVRGNYGGTILMQEDKLDVLDTKKDDMLSACVYPYWHPSGKYIAYSTNKTFQVFHSVRDKRVEVLDLASDILVYDIENNTLLTCDLLQTDDYETFPAFSPDGRTLYFCRATKQELIDYQKIRYNLYSIDFNPETGAFGTRIDTVLVADTLGKTISFPRPSYDGKYLMYTMADYGNFTIWHPEADLYLLNLSDSSTRLLSEVNSNDADSYHSWSSNSHWFVFGSRRIDGLYTRPYIASIDEEGNVGKPFLLPQKNPEHYEASLYSYNVPEFISGPVKMNFREAEKKILSSDRKQVQ